MPIWIGVSKVPETGGPQLDELHHTWTFGGGETSALDPSPLVTVPVTRGDDSQLCHASAGAIPDRKRRARIARILPPGARGPLTVVGFIARASKSR